MIRIKPTRQTTLGCLVGSRPSPRQPLPGTRNVRQGLERPNREIQVLGAISGREREWAHPYGCGTLKGNALRGIRELRQPK